MLKHSRRIHQLIPDHVAVGWVLFRKHPVHDRFPSAEWHQVLKQPNPKGVDDKRTATRFDAPEQPVEHGWNSLSRHEPKPKSVYLLVVCCITVHCTFSLEKLCVERSCCLVCESLILGNQGILVAHHLGGLRHDCALLEQCPLGP